MSGSKTGRVRSKRRKGRSSARARGRSDRAAVGTDGVGVITVKMRSKSGLVTIIRSSRTGRFTAAKSAKVIDSGAARFAGPLKRLATK